MAENTTATIIMGLLNELPCLQRTAVLAYYYDNRNIDEIAEMMECSANIVRKCLKSAKKYLKASVTVHEEKCSRTLCSFPSAVLFSTLKALLDKEAYLLSPSMAQYIYALSCSNVGLCASTIRSLSGTE